MHYLIPQDNALPCYALLFRCFALTGDSAAPNSKMAIPEWIHISHMAQNGSSQQHQCRQRQALLVLVSNTGTTECCAGLVDLKGAYYEKKKMISPASDLGWARS